MALRLKNVWCFELFVEDSIFSWAALVILAPVAPLIDRSTGLVTAIWRPLCPVPQDPIRYYEVPAPAGNTPPFIFPKIAPPDRERRLMGRTAEFEKIRSILVRRHGVQIKSSTGLTLRVQGGGGPWPICAPGWPLLARQSRCLQNWWPQAYGRSASGYLYPQT